MKLDWLYRGALWCTECGHWTIKQEGNGFRARHYSGVIRNQSSTSSEMPDWISSRFATLTDAKEACEHELKLRRQNCAALGLLS